MGVQRIPQQRNVMPIVPPQGSVAFCGVVASGPTLRIDALASFQYKIGVDMYIPDWRGCAVNRLLYADDCLNVLKDELALPTGSVDLIYLDPPFNSNSH